MCIKHTSTHIDVLNVKFQTLLFSVLEISVACWGLCLCVSHERKYFENKLQYIYHFSRVNELVTRDQQCVCSGLLPLFKPGTTNLSGAFIQLQLTSNLCRGNQLLDEDDDVVENGDYSDVDYDSSDSFHQLTGGSRTPGKQKRAPTAAELGPVFTVHLSVERALHLPTVRVQGRWERSCNSFQMICVIKKRKK